jgi:flagellar biosynthesis protein FlhG
MFDALAEKPRFHQASGLQAMTKVALRVLPITTAVWGGGHNACVINLAAALSSLGLRIVVIDAGRSMVAPAIGLKAKFDLLHLLLGERTFQETMLQGESFAVLPATKGLEEFIQSGSSPDDLFGAFTRLSTPFDMVLLLTAPNAIVSLVDPADEVLFVLNEDAESIKSTYASLKRMSEESGFQRFRILFNDVQDASRANDGYARLADTAADFLHAHLSLAGVIPRDPALRRASAALSHVFRDRGAGAARSAFLRVAVDIANWQLPEFSEASE